MDTLVFVFVRSLNFDWTPIICVSNCAQRLILHVNWSTLNPSEKLRHKLMLTILHTYLRCVGVGFAG